MNPASTPETIELELKFGLRDCGIDRISLVLKDLLHTTYMPNPIP